MPLLILILLTMTIGDVTAQAKSSEDILKELPLSKIEGLWSMTAEELLVLIIRNDNGRLDMTVAPENLGSGLKAGQLIGYLEPTADKDCYWLYLEDVPQRKGNLKNVLGTYPFTKRCILRLKDNGEILSIERGSVAVSLKPSGIFPAFSRLIRFQFKNPNSKVHEGFRKIYPGFDGSFGTSQRIVYF